MSRTRMRATVAALVLGGAVLAFGLGGVAARAQVGIPPLPPQLEPVLEVIGPTVSPVCGDATLVLVALPALVALPVPIPPQVQAALAPVAVACGAVPSPTGGYTCGLDQQAQKLVDSITFQAAGTASPVAVTPGAIVTLQVATIEDQLGDADKELAAAKAIAGVFSCVPVQQEATPNITVPPALPPDAAANPPAADVASPAPSTDTGTGDGSNAAATGDLSAPLSEPSSLDVTPTTTAGPAHAAVRPVVVTRASLPAGSLSIAVLIALVAGTALAIAVTRPITSRSGKEH